MMSKFAAPAAFFVGLAVGAGTAWYCAKEKYAHIAEQEIASVKVAYAQREQRQEQPVETPATKLAARSEEHTSTPAPSRLIQSPNPVSAPMSSPPMNLGRSRSTPRSA